MKIVGIIAEFNPFHNGHKYLIKKAKEITNADIAICIISVISHSLAIYLL